MWYLEAILDYIYMAGIRIRVGLSTGGHRTVRQEKERNLLYWKDEFPDPYSRIRFIEERK